MTAGRRTDAEAQRWVAALAPLARPGDLSYDIAVALMPPASGGVVEGPPLWIVEGECHLPCRYCGGAEGPPSHVYGERKCCPDCDHRPEDDR